MPTTPLGGDIREACDEGDHEIVRDDRMYCRSCCLSVQSLDAWLGHDTSSDS